MTLGIAEQVRSWLRKEIPLDVLSQRLSSLEDYQGAEISAAIAELCVTTATSLLQDSAIWSRNTWREALMSCRARTWATPHQVGLLVGPGILMLTDGQQGIILREDQIRCLSESICASLLLLAQTIVMADDALDACEVSELRRQRTEATSTSLSEIKPVQ